MTKRRHDISRSSLPRRRGLTLVELVTSMTIMTILLGAMTSAVLIASHALPTGQSPLEKKTQATDAVDQLAGELFYATAITEATANAVTFTVADRSHGAAGPETIRYEWSGTAGDPLTRQYNDGTVVTLCEDVELFELVYTTRATQLQGAPRVLLIVDDDAALTAQEDAKRQVIESWGFTVQVLSDHRALAEQEVALQSADVVYLAQDALTVPALLGLNPAVGIVCEERSLFPDVGISTSSYWVAENSIVILDNTHEITQPFTLGTLQIFSADDCAISSFGEVAGGGRILAEDPSFPNGMLIAIELDGALSDGRRAPGRRVSLPWGDRTFDFNNVNSDGLTLMQRSIVWAAQPVVYSGVSIVLRPTADQERVRTETQILNLPRANGP